MIVDMLAPFSVRALRTERRAIGTALTGAGEHITGQVSEGNSLSVIHNSIRPTGATLRT
ncbi:hypothetical protein SAMN04490220_2520 [Rhodococcus jostii]|uniref:Uncharacterized protein n=1 Tax=Rhodococcus jostii TaxID=132919 RepID=A0A1H4V852_RHOJO|nr:hypothetical protein SAMN04490220_2520 [Rhodococcus jostii]